MRSRVANITLNEGNIWRYRLAQSRRGIIEDHDVFAGVQKLQDHADSALIFYLGSVAIGPPIPLG
jgi:hypothetical protein